MDFRIADTFTAALTRLTAQEQKAAKTTAFDLQLDPSAPGLKFHRIERSRDPNFWSIRANDDIRIIVHKTASSFLLAYVDHHDRAYAWAERRRIEAHPRTGAIQIVEVRERVDDLLGPPLMSAGGIASTAKPAVSPAEPALFAGLSDDDLMGVGAPADWLGDIRAATETSFFELTDRLPAEVAEALFDYAATGRLKPPEPPVPAADPFAHPDTLRRVRTIESEDELRLALDYPWEKWSVFLHPSQRALVERTFNGPARVMGTAGTGKTVVALHRAARAAVEDPHARVLLATFSRPLANALAGKLPLLLGGEVGAGRRVRVASFQDAAAELFELATGKRPAIAPDDVVAALLRREAEAAAITDLPPRFLLAEWRQVVDAWGVEDLEAYAAVPRIGRRNRLGARQRERLWPVFEALRRGIASRGMRTWPEVFRAVESHFSRCPDRPFTAIIVDEAQDLGVPELRMMAALAQSGSGLFFAGDLGQRIFQQPFSWKALGVDVRGRAATLKVNYRTSRQIREASDRLLPPVVRDVDGLGDDRRGAISVFEGPLPQVRVAADGADETSTVAGFLRAALDQGVAPSEIGVFVRSTEQLVRARTAVSAAGLESIQLTERAEDPGSRIAIGTMHLAKGLEYKAVAVMACDDEVLPLQARVEAATDEDELREIFETERHLFYVACTRARDRLLVTGVVPESEFLRDLGGKKS